ncbi:DUF4190 domain-containing protein [Streptomyces sp. NPDC005438]|uniref:DUF4190 domain-containing protein n=1 Tax=Streptomyces sp. NPDC005438 TaxID=3156880 RepID=UPI0033AF959F
MTPLTSTRPTTEPTASTEPAASVQPAASTEPTAPTAPASPRGGRSQRLAARVRRDADDMAVASFVLGLTGLLVFNLVLGPTALVLGGLALLKRTTRRGRALLGMGLGVADLLVLGLLLNANDTAMWTLNFATW